MTIKRAIAIGTLSAITITLIAFGIKTKSFKPKTTTPFAQHRSAIRVDAEDFDYVSKKWLFNKDLESNNAGTTRPGEFTDTTQQFTAYKENETKTTYTGFAYDGHNNYVASSYYSTYGIYLGYRGAYSQRSYQYATTTSTSANLSHMFSKNEMRIVEFTNAPTGNIYTLLNATARQAYNSDILIFASNAPSRNSSNIWNNNFSYTGINEVRKGNLPISKEDVAEGKFINETGTIQLFVDGGCTSLKINEVEYINSIDTPINITNEDIVIRTAGTNTGNTTAVFTINYFNTRPAITPQPYPDPGDQVIEVIEIMPMMFKILTMPFTFISQAFNVTLWEGTPYQFNFRNFILSLIAIATLLFIIKLFTSGFSIIGNYSANHESRALKRSQTKLNNAKTKQIESGNKSKPSKKG